jgi:hypothetical protein
MGLGAVRWALRATSLIILASCHSSVSNAPVDYLDLSGLKGDVRLWTRDTDIYPKYVLLFPEVDVSQPGTYVFRIAGLPEAELWFGLSMDTAKERNALGGANVDVECDIGREDGTRLIVIDGPLFGDGKHRGGEVWHCFDGYWFEGGRRPTCYGMPPRPLKTARNEEYVIRILVKATDARNVGSLTPVLWGGGTRQRFPM